MKIQVLFYAILGIGLCTPTSAHIKRSSSSSGVNNYIPNSLCNARWEEGSFHSYVYFTKNETTFNSKEYYSKTYQKTKEIEILNLIKDEFPQFNIIHNKSIGFECGNFRPDFVINCNSHIIIIEVDEFQHSEYDQDCERKREERIAEAFYPCIIIRYNPDAYKIDGLTRKTNKQTRQEKLIEIIRSCSEMNVEEYQFKRIRLFYDE